MIPSKHQFIIHQTPSASPIYNPLPLTETFAAFLKLQVLLNTPTDYISKQLPLKTLIPQKSVFADFDYVTGGTYRQRVSVLI